MSQENRSNRRHLLRRLTAGMLIAVVVFSVAAAPVSAEALEAPPRVIVKVESGADIDTIADRSGARVVSATLPSRGLYILEADPAASGFKAEYAEKADKLGKAVEKQRGVVYAEIPSDGGVEDTRFHAWPHGLPTSIGDNPTSWRSQPSLEPLELNRVHQQTTGSGVLVAVLDSGVDSSHPELREHLSPLGYDYIDDDDDPNEERNGVDDDGDGRIDETYGHGTHIAGMVALVAPDAEILAYRVLDSDGRGDPHVVAEAINDAVAAGADVINLSFGVRYKSKNKSDVLKNAIKDAFKSNVSIVIAAGNDNNTKWIFPAEEKSVIAVMALAADNSRPAYFSSRGKWARASAPGEAIVSTLPGGGFGAWSGTSMAAPIVSGQIALVRSVNPDEKAKDMLKAVDKKFKRNKKSLKKSKSSDKPD